MDANSTYLIELLWSLLFGLIRTAVTYTAFPLFRRWLNMGMFESDKAKKIALWNSIVVGTIYFVLTILSDSDRAWSPMPAIFYYWINYFILTEKTKKRRNTMSETEKTESGSVQHCYTRIEYDPKKSQHDYIKQAEQELNLGDPAQQQPVTKAKPAPKQEDVIRELQKQVKMQELSRLSQMYNEKLCRFKRNNKIRWIITFCGFALVYFGVLVVVFPDAEVGLVGLLAVIFTAIHFLINASIFGWLIKKRKADEKQLEPIIKKVQELEKSLNK